MSLLIVGSLAIDGIETPTESRENLLGGSALYCAYAASLFSSVKLVSIIGNDWPEHATQSLAARSIDVTGISRCSEKPSYRWRGRYAGNMDDRDTLSLHLNAYGDFDPQLPDSYRSAPFVFLANLIPTVQLKVLSQLEGNAFVVADTHSDWFADYRGELTEVLQRVTGITLTDSEARMLTGEPDPEVAGRILLEMGPQYVIVKRGTEGVICITASQSYALAAFPTDTVVDPTGAGDSFAGGMMGYLATHRSINQESLRDAIIHGVVVASYTVEEFGIGRLERIASADVAGRLGEYRSK